MLQCMLKSFWLVILMVALSAADSHAMGRGRDRPIACYSNVAIMSFSDQTIEAAYVADQLIQTCWQVSSPRRIFIGAARQEGLISFADIGVEDFHLRNLVLVSVKLQPWEGKVCLVDVEARTIREGRFVDEYPKNYVNEIVSCEEPVADLLKKPYLLDQVREMMRRHCPAPSQQ